MEQYAWIGYLLVTVLGFAAFRCYRNSCAYWDYAYRDGPAYLTESHPRKIVVFAIAQGISAGTTLVMGLGLLPEPFPKIALVFEVLYAVAVIIILRLYSDFWNKKSVRPA